MELWDRSLASLVWLGAAAGVVAAVYAAMAARAWFLFGRCNGQAPGVDADPLLDRFLPRYEVRERHHIDVAAPAALTFHAACTADLYGSRMIRAIFRAREWILRVERAERIEDDRRGLVARAKAWGWGVLAEIPGREIVLGAVTQPWQRDVTFHAIRPEYFATFDEPGYVKIVWNLRVDSRGPGNSLHYTETRAVATGAAARVRFRRYWSFFSPGIVLIRQIAIRMVKAEAERAAGAHGATTDFGPLGSGGVPRH